jgi:uncharacterized protein YehS (DUF1456 family)
MTKDIFKKLRVVMLIDDQIVEILELVDFRITKSKLGAFRDEKRKKITYVILATKCCISYALVIHLRGTKKP